MTRRSLKTITQRRCWPRVEIKIGLMLRQPGMQHADVSGVWPRGR